MEFGVNEKDCGVLISFGFIVSKRSPKNGITMVKENSENITVRILNVMFNIPNERYGLVYLSIL